MKTLFRLLLLSTIFYGHLLAATIVGGDSIEDAGAIPTFNEVHLMAKGTTDKYLKFDLQKGEGVAVALTVHSNTGDMHMYAYTPENQASSFESVLYVGDGETEALSFTAGTTGTYYLRITGSAGIADIAVYQSFYTVGVSDSVRDFHLTFNTAHYLTGGNHIRNSEGLSDYYRFEVKALDEVSISLTAHSNSGDMHMYAYTAENQASSFESVLYIGNGETKALSFTAYTSGVYYLKVTGVTGNYDLLLNGTRVNIDTDEDGLDNCTEYIRGTRIDNVDTNGNTVSDYNEAMLGEIGAYQTEWTRLDMENASSFPAAKVVPYLNALFSFDKDTTDRYLKFNLLPDEEVTVSLKVHSNAGDMHMYAYTPENQASSFESVLYVGDGEIKTLSFTAETTGTYYLKITGSAGIADIAVYQSFNTVGVYDSVRDFHSTFNTAHYLTGGNHIRNSDGLSDYYRFKVETFDEISISLTAHSNTGDIHMYAYTPENQASSFESVLYVGDGETGAISFTAYTPGFYYIRVTGSTDSYDFLLDGVRVNDDLPVKINPAIILYLLN